MDLEFIIFIIPDMNCPTLNITSFAPNNNQSITNQLYVSYEDVFGLCFKGFLAEASQGTPGSHYPC